MWGQWSRSEVDGKFVALTAVCSTHGCVQLCEDAKAVRVSPLDAAVFEAVRSLAGGARMNIGMIQRVTKRHHM